MPSSFITSQITPAGFRPARRARSTAASVCPARSRTPPARLFSGNTWPGWTRSRGALSGSIATWIVCARSWAEMPVVTPSRASTDTVNGVSKDDSFLAAIRSSPSSSQRSEVSDRQISPRPSLAMKLIASGVANWAAIVRSPSFSRSSSSQTTTILPCLISSIASSIVANDVVVFDWLILCGSPSTLLSLMGTQDKRGQDVGDEVCSAHESPRTPRRAVMRAHQSLYVLGENVRLDVDPIPDLRLLRGSCA